ncbi:DUF106 domain-containing protein [Candidatus Woesearchaeota archaeon]|nr:DUF106 domain-containing protein [Candidatus Woesearchaeota archaeon]
MGILDTLNNTLNIILSPLLALPPLWAITLLSFSIALLTTLIYKWTTNQSVMKELKDEIKKLQEQAKQLKDQPDKAMEIHKKVMETNMQYMSHSMKPTLITFLPIIIIFGWMQKNFANAGTLLNLGITQLGWLGTYFITTIIFSMLLRKILKLH